MRDVGPAALGIAPSVESEVEEHKEAWGEGALQALAALSNTRGGVLWIGVQDDGRPVEPGGWAHSENPEKLTAVVNQIVSKLGIYPSSVTIERLNEKPVLAIVVPRASSPVSLDGTYWRRVGNSSRRVPGDELTRFLLEQSGKHWDETLCDVTIEELNLEELSRFKLAARHRLSAIRESDEPTYVLRNLGLMDHGGSLKRAAVMLFGSERAVQRLSPTSFVQVGRIGDGGTLIEDAQVVKGNLFAQLEGVLAEIDRILPSRFLISSEQIGAESIESLRRQDVRPYPLVALREAVSNALIHRDYAHRGRIMVRIYRDRLIVSSPGGLPDGLVLADLVRVPHPSILRNPALAEGFFLAGLVERWGTGTTRMLEACESAGLPEPEFQLQGGEFWVVFSISQLTESSLNGLGLNERQIMALRRARAIGSLTNRSYRELTGVSARTALSDLASLVEKGLLKQSGRRGASTSYVLAIK